MIESVNFWDTISFIFSSSYGFLFFIPIYALWVIILLPGLWLSMLAGAIYGTLLGTILVFIGASLGAVIAFFLSRRFFRAWFLKRLQNYPKIESVQKIVSKEGLKLIILTRLSPAFPFSLLNYTYGLSEVSFKDYIIGLSGIIPGTIFFCTLGHLAKEVTNFGTVLAANQNTSYSIMNILALIATLAAIWILISSIQKALQESEELN